MAASSLVRAPRLLKVLGIICAFLALAGSWAVTVEAAPTIGGCAVFPASNIWNTDISSLPVHQRSASWLANMGGPTRLLHPDFGPSGGFPYGIPFNVVDSGHAKINVKFTYSSESDHVAYPFGADTLIEGGPRATGDRHAIMIDRTSCTLYELYNANYRGPAGSTAGSGATWRLGGNALRPAGWTSADAAGLPIFPGLLRVEEVQAGVIQHAIRFTAQQTDRSFVWPARHQAGAAVNPALPPMGARFRLRAGFDTSRFSPATRVVLNAMKHYGLMLADNGSNWYFQGAAQSGWSDAMISQLKTIPAGQFDAIDESSLMLDPNSAQARQPGALAPATVPAPPPAAVGGIAPAAAPGALAVTSGAAQRQGRAQAGPYLPTSLQASTNPRPRVARSWGFSVAAWAVVAFEVGVLGIAGWVLRNRLVGWLSGPRSAPSRPAKKGGQADHQEQHVRHQLQRSGRGRVTEQSMEDVAEHTPV